MRFNQAKKRAVEYFESGQFKSEDGAGDPSMIKYTSILAEINKLGFITTDSQGGQCDDVYKERAYIEGFMRPAMAMKFMKEFNIQTDKIAMYIRPIPDKMGPSPSKLAIPVTLLMDGKTKVHSHLDSTISKSYIKDIQKDDIDDEVVMIVCLDAVWCRDAMNGLFEDVKRVLETIN
jgi:hypothetical protein